MLVDVEKAIQPQLKLSLVEIVEHLLEHYHAFAQGIDVKEATMLSPHWSSIDHEIPSGTDANGKEDEVPSGLLYSMSCDKLLVLQKELTSLLDKGFISESKSPAPAPVLFAKIPGSGLQFCMELLWPESYHTKRPTSFATDLRDLCSAR